eukprot:2734262-Karenia_brevis.AAC.1
MSGAVPLDVAGLLGERFEEVCPPDVIHSNVKFYNMHVLVVADSVVRVAQKHALLVNVKLLRVELLVVSYSRLDQMLRQNA